MHTHGGTVRALGAGMHGLRPQGDAEAGRQAHARASARAGPQQGALCAQPLSRDRNFRAGGWGARTRIFLLSNRSRTRQGIARIPWALPVCVRVRVLMLVCGVSPGDQRGDHGITPVAGATAAGRRH
eukprot:6547250-Prymnesium_polylepis.1